MKNEIVTTNCARPAKKGFIRRLFKFLIFIIALQSIGKAIVKLLNKLNNNRETDKDNDKKVYKLLCEGRDIKIENETFKGADIANAFSGLKLDLSKAVIENDVVINCKNFMSGVSIIVPENVKVELTPKSILSGVVNYVPMVSDQIVPTIQINVDSIMSGFEVKVLDKETLEETQEEQETQGDHETQGEHET
jgi:predicted membrane protein